jgi:DNA replication protein DnaC
MNRLAMLRLPMGILDRLVHNAHRIEMRGDSMRKNRGKANA